MILRRDVPAAMAAAAVRDGRWERVRRGAFVPRAPGGRFTQLERHALARIIAVDDRLSVDHVISHQSAALLWGLPLVDDGAAVHIIQAGTPRHTSVDLRRHRHRLSDDETAELGGRRVTSLERTIADCASSLPAREGLVVADAALRRGLNRSDCLERLHAKVGRRGTRRALAVVELADDGAESPGESRLRHLVLRAGLPVPRTQVRVDTADGPAWGDIGWESWNLLAEYDGAAKYTAGSPAAESVLRERRREVAVERTGWHVMRATARDIHRPRPFLGALLRFVPGDIRANLRPRIWLA